MDGHFSSLRKFEIVICRLSNSALPSFLFRFFSFDFPASYVGVATKLFLSIYYATYAVQLTSENGTFGEKGNFFASRTAHLELGAAPAVDQKVDRGVYYHEEARHAVDLLRREVGEEVSILDMCGACVFGGQAHLVEGQDGDVLDPLLDAVDDEAGVPDL